MKLQVNGIKAEMAKLKANLEAAKQLRLKPVSEKLVAELKEATPVKTGHARDGWQVEYVNGKAIITNDVPYIKELNEGTSAQAPAFFIEKVVLENKDVTPSGVIVSYR